MSNGLAIAAVTSTLRFVLDRALQHPHPGQVGGARVTTVRPDQLTDSSLTPGPSINVFLYQVTPNHAWNLADLPTRSPDGSLSQRPLAALDLQYLITCHGQDDSLDAQRLLGRTVTALAVTPVLTHDVVVDAMDAYSTEAETTFLAEADLAAQVELVKMSPTPMSLEELSKLWSVMLQTPYLLSVTYTATVVLIEADVTPRAVLPVRSRNLTVTPAGPQKTPPRYTQRDCPGNRSPARHVGGPPCGPCGLRERCPVRPVRSSSPEIPRHLTKSHLCRGHIQLCLGALCKLMCSFTSRH